jgi:hypothetical protein
MILFKFLSNKFISELAINAVKFEWNGDQKMEGVLIRLNPAKVEKIVLIMLLLLSVISPALSQGQSGTWVLTDIRDDIQKNQDTEPYPFHSVEVSKGNEGLTLVDTKETWTGDCSGHAESSSSWTELPEALAPGSILGVTTKSAISGGATCSEHYVGAFTQMYVYGAQRLSNILNYWTSEKALSPSTKISDYEVPEGKQGDQMEVLMIGGGPGGRLLRYYTYDWQQSALECGWCGTWDTEWGPLELQQSGSSVIGTYTHDQGRIQGTVSGNKLIGTWSESPSYSPPDDAGDFEFTMSDDCGSFNGVWRYGSIGDWSGSWSGTR